MFVLTSTSTLAFEPVSLSLEPDVPVSAVDAMWFVWPWDVDRSDGRITISATHSW